MVFFSAVLSRRHTATDPIHVNILAVTNMYPTKNAPHSGIFVEQQIQSLQQIGLTVRLMVVERLEKGMGVYVGLQNKVKAAIRALNPDIVHVMYGGVMAEIVTRAVSNIPSIVTFHGSDLLGEHLSGKLRQLIAGYGVWASWRAARRTTGIVAVSEVLVNSLPPDIDRKKVRIIPCGIDLNRFRPMDRDTCRQKLGWDKSRFHILFPANGGDPVKRIDVAEASVSALRRLGVAPEMHQLRGVDNRDVPVWLNASDALLITSRHEGSPTVVKEALACDLPIVSVDVGDISERVKGISGCYIASANPDDLASKLSLVHKGNRRIVGRPTVEHLSLENIALQLKTFYTAVQS